MANGSGDKLRPDPEMIETIAALCEALAELDGGNRGTPLEEFDRAFRKEHGLDLNENGQ